MGNDPGDSPPFTAAARMPEPDYDDGVYKDDDYDEEAVQAVMAMSAPQGQRLTFPGASVLQSRSYDEDDTQYDDGTLFTFDDEQTSLPHDNPIVAQLAHNDVDDVAARVAERLERRMTERLRREVEARMALERSNQYMADQLAANATSQQQPQLQQQPQEQQHHYHPPTPPPQESHTIQRAEEAPELEDESDDNFKVCGIQRTCWGLILTTIFLVMTAGLTSMIFHYTNTNYVDKGSTSKPPPGESTVAPTSSATPSQEVVERWGSIMQKIGDLIVFDPNDDPFQDQSTVQYRAFNWLANVDDYKADVNNESIPDYELVERYALAVLYYADLGRTWSNQLEFLTPTSVCSWNNGVDSKNDNAMGVYCDNGRVTFIQLVGNGLKGRLPQEVALLSNMIHLNLDKNVLFGNLPNLERLTNLEVLWLSSNNFLGTLPSEFAQLSSLASLDLEDNSFTGSLPSEWGSSLTNLFFLGLRLNNLDGTLPNSFWQQMPNMRFLDIEGNSFEGTLPTQLGFLTNLESLYMEKNRFTGPLPSELGRLTKLTELLVYGNRLEGIVPTEYSSLTNLKYFWFHATDLKGSVDTIFCNDPFIQSLSGDCYGDPGQVTCTCCSQCCNAFGEECQQNVQSS